MLVQNHTCRSFLVVQCLGLVPRSRGHGSASSQGTKGPHATRPKKQSRKQQHFLKECLPLPLIFFSHMWLLLPSGDIGVCVCTCVRAGACANFETLLCLAVCTLSHFYHYKWFRGHKETVAERGLKTYSGEKRSWNLDTGRCFSWYPGPGLGYMFFHIF